MTTMSGILSEMISLFPDEFFHLGLDETFNSVNCTSDSKSYALDILCIIV